MVKEESGEQHFYLRNILGGFSHVSDLGCSAHSPPSHARHPKLKYKLHFKYRHQGNSFAATLVNGTSDRETQKLGT